MWLNWACLGRQDVKNGHLDIGHSSAELRQSYADCISWVTRWVGCSPNDVVLTSGTTEACDVVLRYARPTPSCILYTDQSHVTVRNSAVNAARYLTRVSDCPVSVAEVAIEDLIGMRPKECADRIVQRVYDISGAKAGVLILEHITSLLGVTLPVGAIAGAISERDNPIHLVVDGAQAAGIEPVPQDFTGSYIGCFHKYIDGPIACGFATVRGLDSAELPYYLAARLSTECNEGDAVECLPTDDLQKWAACRNRLAGIERSRVENSFRAQIIALRRVFSEAIKPITALPLLPIDSPYKSHIAAFDCGDPARASLVHDQLSKLDYHVKVEGRWLRVTLHHTLDIARVESFAGELRRLLLETK